MGNFCGGPDDNSNMTPTPIYTGSVRVYNEKHPFIDIDRLIKDIQDLGNIGDILIYDLQLWSNEANTFFAITTDICVRSNSPQRFLLILQNMLSQYGIDLLSAKVEDYNDPSNIAIFIPD